MFSYKKTFNLYVSSSLRLSLHMTTTFISNLFPLAVKVHEEV